jgi:uncharacterized membrane protein YhaH (DUF805 family)
MTGKKIATTVRIVTAAPIMALILLLILFLRAPQTFGNTLTFISTIAFLVVVPLLAYPLQPLFKKYKDGGREGQRKLAMVFAVVGYVGGLLTAILSGATQSVLVIYISYLISGLLVALTNKLLHFKASGHACGVAGPFLILIYLGQPIGYLGIGALAITWLASLYMKRHTWVQLLAGSAIPFIAFALINMMPLS